MTTLLLGVLAVCFFYICFLNLSLTPSFYCTDMYSDILYSVRAWEEHSLFPDGWVFGNQLYVIATPVLASLIYGITGHPALSMAIASIIMTVGVALSFLWMLKPVFPRLNERLVGLLCFIALVSYSGDAIYSVKGWQLFFTLCSYYACYAITAFLCFGCFLRRRDKLKKTRIALLIIAALLAFGSGMQSLRQTAVMLPPMLAIEAVMQIKSLVKRKKLELQPLLITGGLSLANLLGLFVIRLMNVPQKEIFSSTDLLEKSEIPNAINHTWTNLASLLTDKEHYGVLLLMAVIVAALALIQAKRQKDSVPAGWGSLVALLSISVLGIAAIDALTQMSVRSIYYFMAFPLVALLPVYAYRRWKFGKIFALVVVAMLVVGSF